LYETDRNDLVENYKIINGVYNAHNRATDFFEFDQSGRSGHSKSYIKVGLDWMLGNLFLVIEYLTEISYKNSVACSTVCCLKISLLSRLGTGNC